MTHCVTFVPGGHQISVEDDDGLMAEALRTGFRVPMGCRMGMCRTCICRVVSGDYDLGNAHTSYLTQEDRDAGLIMLCQAHAKSDLVVEIEEAPFLAEPRKLPALVNKIERLSDNTMILRLRLPLHSNLMFAAGQFIDVLLPDGQRRSYSIANAPRAQGVIDVDLHIRHMRGGLFTDQLFGSSRERDKLQIEAPLGGFYLRESDKSLLFLATGTGYAPVRSIVLNELAIHPERKIVLYWGARTLGDLYLHQEALELSRQHANFKYVPVLSRGDANWAGECGHVQDIAARDLTDLSDWQVYSCGSPQMVRQARDILTDRCGLAEADYFADAFTSMADFAKP